MTAGPLTAIRAGTVLTLTGEEFDGPGGVLVKDGRIEAVLPAAQLDSVTADSTVDLGSRTLLPGFVDPHAHAEVACKATFEMADVRAPGCVDVAAVLVENPTATYLIRAEGVSMTQAGIFDGDTVTGLCDGPCGKKQRNLAAARQQDLVRADCEAARACEPFR